MAKYVTRIEAPKASYPVLLGNGNLKDKGDLPGGDRCVGGRGGRWEEGEGGQVGGGRGTSACFVREGVSPGCIREE